MDVAIIDREIYQPKKGGERTELGDMRLYVKYCLIV